MTLNNLLVANIEYFDVLLPLGLIILLSKILVMLCKKLGLPSVVGMLLAGVIVGLINYIPKQTVLTETTLEGIGFIAKIGVVLIMFSAGLGTDVKQIKAVGIPAVIITMAGVILPLGLGFVVATLTNGGFAALNKTTALTNIFYGTVLTATSVSITVATLKELGALNSKVGNTIVSAAILDDIIGIIVLSFVVSMGGGSDVSPLIVLLKTILFFIAIFAFGFIISKFFKWLDEKYPHHRRIPILSLGFCFLVAYASEKIFGVADITGAYAFGLILANNPESNYIDRKADIISYMFFSPVFFANVGLTTKFSAMSPDIILFGILFILAGIAGKFIGCSLTAKACKYSTIDSVRIGLGMMARAEVALVCAQKGFDLGIIDPAITPFILILIISTSFITPILLKLSYKKEKQPLPQPIDN